MTLIENIEQTKAKVTEAKDAIAILAQKLDGDAAHDAQLIYGKLQNAESTAGDALTTAAELDTTIGSETEPDS